jgi:hypothetical protein
LYYDAGGVKNHCSDSSLVPAGFFRPLQLRLEGAFFMLGACDHGRKLQEKILKVVTMVESSGKKF